MTDVTHTQLLDTLNEGWGAYIARFHGLSPDTQAAWLTQQGYTRFGDLLAHVAAWWTEGQQTVESFIADPHLAAPEYDVDAFNAHAVAQFGALDEDAIIDAFEKQRAQWVVLLAGVSDATLAVPKIADRLHIEIIGHLAEHQLP